MKYLLFVYLLSTVFFTCQRTDNDTAAAEMNDSELADPLTADLYCEKAETTDGPAYELYLQSSLFEGPIYIAEISHCNRLKADQYGRYHIADRALSALDAAGADGGPLFYAFVDADSSVIVMQGLKPAEEVVGEVMQYDIFRRISLGEDGKFTVEQFMPEGS